MKLIIQFLFLFIICVNGTAKEKSIKSFDDENCKIFLKQNDKSTYQKVRCTTKTRYPIPEMGYDKEHCIYYRARGYGKQVGKTSGLYCSIDGYKGFDWYYVK